MSHDRQNDTNIERRQELQHDEETFQLRQEEKRLQAAKLTTSIFWSWTVLVGLLILGISIHVNAIHLSLIFALISFLCSIFVLWIGQ
jgi:hypothetical protein